MHYNAGRGIVPLDWPLSFRDEPANGWDMPGPPRWQRVIENATELSSEVIYLTPLSRRVFRIPDAQDGRILIEYRDDSDTISLQREQFEGLYERIQDTRDGFEFGRLPPNAEPYATVLSLHPRIEVESQERRLRESDDPVSSPFIDVDEEPEPSDQPD